MTPYFINMKASLYIIFFFLGIGLCSAQEIIDQMVDSLNLTTSSAKKVDLALRIAEKLQDTDLERSLIYFELAENESKKNENHEKLLGDVYFALASLYHNKGVLDISLDFYNKALNLYSEIDNKKEISKVENNLAIIYSELNNEEKASQFFNKVYQFQKKSEDTFRLAQILNNMGTFYLKRNLDSSEHYYNKSLTLSRALNDSALYTYNFTSLGRVYNLKGKDSLSNFYFNQAKTILKSNPLNPAQDYLFYTLAEIFSKNQKLDSAIFYAKKTLDLNKNNPYNFSSLNSLDILYKNYIKKENYKEASHYFLQFNQVRDSLNIEEQAVNVERLRLQEEFKNKTKIRQLQQEKTQFRYLIIGLALLTGILTLLLILIKLRNRIQKNRLERELLMAKQLELKQNLEYKNKALVGKAMTEIHRTDIINGILNDLKKIKLGAVKKETQQSIDYILKRLKLDLNTDIWKEFEVSFEQVHKSFYKNLQKNHPDLTPKDRRLCAMLFLDLTSKEVSQLTGQDFKSVENARTRLRKKLNLTNTKENLSTYLNTLT